MAADGGALAAIRAAVDALRRSAGLQRALQGTLLQAARARGAEVGAAGPATTWAEAQPALRACLDALGALGEAFEARAPAAELSLADQDAVRVCLEAVLAWGVAPALPGGFGVPLASRSGRVVLEPPRFEGAEPERLEWLARCLALLQRLATALVAAADAHRPALSSLASLVETQSLADRLAVAVFLSLVAPPSPSPSPPALLPFACQHLVTLLRTRDRRALLHALSGLAARLAPRHGARCADLLACALASPGTVHALLVEVCQAGGDASVPEAVQAHVMRVLCRPPSDEARVPPEVRVTQDAFFGGVLAQLATEVRSLAVAQPRAGVPLFGELVARAVVAVCSAAPPAICRAALVDVVAAPLVGHGASAVGERRSLSGERVLYSEDELERCLRAHLLPLLSHTTADARMASAAIHLLRPLAALSRVARRGKSGVLQDAQAVLRALLSRSADSDLLAALFALCAEGLGADACRFRMGDAAGVCVVDPASGVEAEAEAEADLTLDPAVASVLASRSALAGQLLMALLREFVRCRALLGPGAAGQPLRAAEDLADLGTRVLRVLAAAEALLQYRVSVNVASPDTLAVFAELLRAGEHDSVGVALAALQTLLVDAHSFAPSERSALDVLRGPLSALAREADGPWRDAAWAIQIALFAGPQQQQQQQQEQQRQSDPTHASDEAMLAESEAELQSDDPSARAHAMGTVRKLLKAKSRVLLSAETAGPVFDRVARHVHDPEPYVYQAAIRTLAELGRAHPSAVFPRVAAKCLDVSLSSEARAKLVETLVEMCEAEGDMLVVHAQLVFGTLTRCCRDELPPMRASALSALSELCRLRFAMHPFIDDLCRCALDALQTERELECQRAACFLLRRLADALAEPDMWLRHQEPAAAVARAGRLVAGATSDPVCRAQAADALAVLEGVAAEITSLAVSPLRTPQSHALPRLVTELADNDDERK